MLNNGAMAPNQWGEGSQDPARFWGPSHKPMNCLPRMEPVVILEAFLGKPPRNILWDPERELN